MSLKAVEERTRVALATVAYLEAVKGRAPRTRPPNVAHEEGKKEMLTFDELGSRPWVLRGKLSPSRETVIVKSPASGLRTIRAAARIKRLRLAQNRNLAAVTALRQTAAWKAGFAARKAVKSKRHKKNVATRAAKNAAR